MRVGIDCHNLEGQITGVGRYLSNLLREWQNLPGSDPGKYEKVEFFLYFKSEVPVFLRSYNNRVGDNWNFRVSNCGSNALLKHWFLPRVAVRDKVDILFCPDYVLPFYVGDRNSHIKTAVALHDIIYESRPDEYSWPSWKDKILLKWASKRSAKMANVIFTPSEFTKKEVIKHYRVSPDKIVVTPLAPDPIFKKNESQKTVQLAGDIPVSRPDLPNLHYKKYIFFVGSIFNRRFVPQCINGFTQFANKNPDFQFLIIGKNHTHPYQDIRFSITQANKNLGREAVIWREYASDEELVNLYNGAFATLWLSSYEGFGLPVLESMSCGTPVITSKMGSLPEIAGDAAFYIDNPQDSEEIARALSVIVTNATLYSSVVKKSLIQTRRFSWKECARQTFTSLISRNKC